MDEPEIRLEVRPAGAPEPELSAATVAFGSPPRPSRLAGRLADLADRVPGLRLLRGRPASPGRVAVVAAAVGALVSGGAVAVYQDRPVEVVEPGPVPVQHIVEPETWLTVTSVPPGAGLGPAPVDRVEPDPRAALAAHPADAIVVVVARRLWDGGVLVGVPPGRYLLQASCTVPGPDPELGRVEFRPTHGDGGLSDVVSYGGRYRCDGQLHLVDEPTLTDYAAVQLQYLLEFPDLGEAGPPVDPTGRQLGVVVFSFTPVTDG